MRLTDTKTIKSIIGNGKEFPIWMTIHDHCTHKLVVYVDKWVADEDFPTMNVHKGTEFEKIVVYFNKDEFNDNKFDNPLTNEHSNTDEDGCYSNINSVRRTFYSDIGFIIRSLFNERIGGAWMPSDACMDDTLCVMFSKFAYKYGIVTNKNNTHNKGIYFFEIKEINKENETD